jgi:RNA polymerase sigma factor (sigma-70 family)
LKQETLKKHIEDNLDWMYQHAMKYDSFDYEDIVHQIVLRVLGSERVYVNAPENMTTKDFRNWFSAYVYWQFRDGQRRVQRQFEDEIPFCITGEGHPTPDVYENINLKTDLEKAFAQFKEPFRTQLREVLTGAVTVEKLAKELRVPFKTMEARVYRAKKKLQASLKIYSAKSKGGMQENSTVPRYVYEGNDNDVSA